MIAARIDYKCTTALKTLSYFMFGTCDKWYSVAESINSFASPERKLSVVLNIISNDLITLGNDWENIQEMIDSTINNIKFDVMRDL